MTFTTLGVVGLGLRVEGLNPQSSTMHCDCVWALQKNHSGHLLSRHHRGLGKLNTILAL